MSGIRLAMKTETSDLTHPSVDTKSLVKAVINGRTCTSVSVTCPCCGAVRRTPVGVLRAQLRAGGFTGRCAACARNQAEKLAVPPALFPIEFLGVRKFGNSSTHAARTVCASCGLPRVWQLSALRSRLEEDPAFQPLCRECTEPRKLRVPEHPAVRPDSLIRMLIHGAQQYCVTVACDGCGTDRWVPLGALRRQIKTGAFTGRCKSCREKHLTRLELGFNHASIDHERIKRGEIRGIACSVAPVTCPICAEERWVALSDLRIQHASGKFTGRCRRCSLVASRATLAKHRATLPPAVPRLNAGYREIPRSCVPPEDIWLFDAMVSKAKTILEHRLVYAKLLGRPLRTEERVDHRNGQRADNAPDNLRLYLTNLNEEGSCSGAGVFYDEWQRAEARAARAEQRLAELEAQLLLLPSPPKSSQPNE